LGPAGGLVVAALRGAARGAFRPGTSIAFGPYLCLSGWLVWLYGPLQVSP
jgi:prepilin signal peptidase PulO-like enzyme (type II secretory pathway)